MIPYLIASADVRTIDVRVALVDTKAPWFYEIADALIDALVGKGHDAVLVVDTAEALQARWARVAGGGWWIVLTPECFSALPRARAIAYNFEQLDARATTAHPAAIAHLVRVCRGAAAIWDFSARNNGFWQTHGLTPKHVPLAYSPKMTYGVPFERDADVCVFMGNVYGRRIALVDALRARLGAHRFCVVSDAFCYGDPYATGQKTAVAAFTRKAAVLARARLVVNLKPVDPALTCLETPRLWWCVANRVFVVSERDDDRVARQPFEAAGAVCFVETARLAETIVDVMAEPVARTRARARAAFALLACAPQYGAMLPAIKAS